MTLSLQMLFSPSVPSSNNDSRQELKCRKVRSQEQEIVALKMEDFLYFLACTKGQAWRQRGLAHWPGLSVGG